MLADSGSGGHQTILASQKTCCNQGTIRRGEIQDRKKVRNAAHRNSAKKAEKGRNIGETEDKSWKAEIQKDQGTGENDEMASRTPRPHGGGQGKLFEKHRNSPEK